MPTKFDFISPGVMLREIDQSVLPPALEEAGPIIIGRTRTGPAMKPVKVRSMDDFIAVFGRPVPGGSTLLGDIWRDGNTIGPTYASYAAQSWLASGNSPVTMVRLLGDGTAGSTDAGWQTSGSVCDSDEAANGGAYGLFLVNSASVGAGATGSLGAIFYVNKGSMLLSGTIPGSTDTTASAGCLIQSGDGAVNQFTIVVKDTTGEDSDKMEFNFTRNNPNYIRNVFNTNPQLTNPVTVATSAQKTYWLGESFERSVGKYVTSGSAEQQYGILLALESGSVGKNWAQNKTVMQEATSGWVFCQNNGTYLNTYQAENMQKLFRVVALSEGSEIQSQIVISIEDLKLPTNPAVDSFSTFSLKVLDYESGQTLEEYGNLNLNPASPNYIGQRIGDMYQEWNDQKRRYNLLGDFPNNSNYIRVEVDESLQDAGGPDNKQSLPFGFYGPVRPKGFTVSYGSSGPQVFGDGVNSGTFASASVLCAMAGNEAAVALDGLTWIIDDGINDAITYTFSGDNTDITRVSSVAYTVGSGSITSATVGADRIIAAINTAKTNGDSYIDAVDYGTTVGLTASVVTTAPNSKAITGTLISVTPNSASVTAFAGGTDTDDFAGAFVKANANVPYSGGDASLFAKLPTDYTASFKFPALTLRENGNDGYSNNPYKVYWGIRPTITTDSSLKDPDYCDYIRRWNAPNYSVTPGDDKEYSFIFSLDDIVVTGSTNTVKYVDGSAYANESRMATSGATDGSNTGLLDLGIKQFVMPLFGGFNGLDITEAEPFRNSFLNGAVESSNYALWTLNKAIDTVADPEVAPANLMVVPGIYDSAVTNRLINTCERRKDSLAIIDIQNDYVPVAEGTDSASDRRGNVDSAVRTLRDRNFNTSYACCFYPWIQISDNLNASERVWVPSSVAGLGAMAQSEAKSAPWFAPAGFNRGGLGNLGGQSGPRVTQARQRLDSSQRDDLYEVNINPIATFPSEGVVIFGQKTLQATPSALDRINVRRLLLYLKSRVNHISRNLLFDQNVESTWARFTSQVEPILADVQARYGLTEYKLILDETTTTPDLIDRNIMYAKIFLKPARAIEYIVVDFIITRTGADFA